MRIHNRTAWGDGTYREGQLTKVVGALDEDTRMARVLVEVPDPHAIRPNHEGRPRLMIGAYVETRIPARPLPGVVRLNRDYVRDGDTVWVMEPDSTLSIRDVDVVARDATYAYIRDGLDDGDRVVTTNLTTVTDGAPLRLDGSPDDEGDVPEPAQ